MQWFNGNYLEHYWPNVKEKKLVKEEKDRCGIMGGRGQGDYDAQMELIKNRTKYLNILKLYQAKWKKGSSYDGKLRWG